MTFKCKVGRVGLARPHGEDIDRISGLCQCLNDIGYAGAVTISENNGHVGVEVVHINGKSTEMSLKGARHYLLGLLDGLKGR